MPAAGNGLKRIPLDYEELARGRPEAVNLTDLHKQLGGLVSRVEGAENGHRGEEHQAWLLAVIDALEKTRNPPPLVQTDWHDVMLRCLPMSRCGVIHGGPDAEDVVTMMLYLGIAYTHHFVSGAMHRSNYQWYRRLSVESRATYGYTVAATGHPVRFRRDAQGRHDSS